MVEKSHLKTRRHRRGIANLTAIAAIFIIVIILLYLFGFVSDLSELLLLVIAGGIGAFYLWYASGVIRKKPVTGVESLVGAKGEVHSETLSGEGEVSIDGVIWRAHLANPAAGPLKKGEVIVVNNVEDLTLTVDRSTVLAKV